MIAPDEDGEIVLTAIDDGGYAPIRIDFEIPVRLLILGREVDRLNLIRKAKLFEGNGSFPPVRRWRRIKYNHTDNSPFCRILLESPRPRHTSPRLLLEVAWPLTMA